MKNKTALPSIIPIIIQVMCIMVAAGPALGQIPDIDLSISPDLDTKDSLTDEDAAILFSSLAIKMKKNWEIEYEFFMRMKLLSEKACLRYGDIHISYFKQSQKIKGLKGHTLTPDGKEIKAKRIADYMPGKNLPIYDDQAIKVLSMPGLSKGCDIEYSYKLESDDLGMLGHYSDFVTLTHTVPVKELRLTIKVPKYIDLYCISNNVDKEAVVETDGSYRQYSWTVMDIEPLRVEEGLPPLKTITSWIAVSTLDSWDDFIRGWRRIYGMRAAVNPSIKKLTKELIAGANTDKEKAEKIFYYVQNKIRYLGVEFGRAGWIPCSAASVLKDKSGDCKGKTVLCIAMMKVAGITAYPAMLSARSNGPLIKDFCDDMQFSHVIPVCDIKGDLVWMDPTSRAQFGTVPGPFQGVEALVIKKDEGGFYSAPVSTASDNKIDMYADIACKPDGSAGGSMKIEGYGNTASNYKISMEGMNKELQEQFIQTMANQWVPRASIKKYTYSDYLDVDAPMRVDFDFHSPNYAQRSNELLIIDPLFCKDPRIDFIKKERFYDMELDVRESSRAKEVIAIPDGFTVDSIPENYRKENPYFKAEISYEAGDNQVTKESYFEWLTTSIPKSAYGEFKDDLNEYESLMNRKIILRKI